MDPTIPPACGSCAEEATMTATQILRICSLAGSVLMCAAPTVLADDAAPAPSSPPAPAAPAQGGTAAAAPSTASKPDDTSPAEAVVAGEIVPGVQYYLSSTNRDSAKFEEYRE